MTCQTLTNHAAARSEIFSRNEKRLQISRLLRNWIVRRKVRALNDHEDSILNDIGIQRHEIIWASRLPITVNAAIALDDRASRRRQRETLINS